MAEIFNLFGWPFLVSLVLSVIFTLALLKIFPKAKPARFGGLAVIGALILALVFHPTLVLVGPLLGLCVGLAGVAVLGALDDFFNLPALWQMVFQVGLALVPLFFGLRLFGVEAPLPLDLIKIGPLVLPEMLFVIFWIVLIINAVNWFDGLDGLASGVGSVAALALFFVSLLAQVNEPPLAVIAISLFGALLGFFIFNRPPAKMFLGTTGSWAIGFTLGTLSVLAGSKLATAALVLALPLIDFLWVIVERWRSGQPVYRRDFRHWHHFLRARGWSDWQILALTLGLSAALGLMAVILPSQGKVIGLIIMAGAIFLAGLLSRRGKPSGKT